MTASPTASPTKNPTSSPTLPPGPCDSGVCDTCELACPYTGTGSNSGAKYNRVSTVTGYSNVHCCVNPTGGGSACEQTTISAPNTTGGIICARGHQALYQSTINIPTGGVCCDSMDDSDDDQQACKESGFREPNPLSLPAGQRVPITCWGKEACFQTEFGDTRESVPNFFPVNTPVDLCCNGFYACAQIGKGDDAEFGPPNGSRIDCRDRLPNSGDDNALTCEQSMFGDRNGGGVLASNEVCCQKLGDGEGSNPNEARQICKQLCPNSDCNCVEQMVDQTWCEYKGPNTDLNENGWGQWTCSNT